MLSGSSPNELELEDPSPLNAAVMDPFTGRRVTGGVRMNVTFFRLGSDGSNVTMARNMTSTGEATNRTVYPNNNKTYAYVARLDSVSQDGVVPQGVVSSPVQLTVSNSSRILLDIIHDDSSVWHTVYGYLKYNDTGIPNRLVKVKVNSTEYARLTDVNGYFSLGKQYFNPYGNLSTYIITATFEGDTGTNVTAWANAPEGTPYPACTTIQYAYQASSNMSILHVDPRAGRLLRILKSPDQVRKEALNNGSLRIWHEWSWWYPWYRFHAVININGAQVDVGFSPIFPDIGNRHFNFPSQFLPPIPITINQGSAGEIFRNTVVGTAVEIFGFAGLVIAAAHSHIPFASMAGLVIYFGGLVGLFTYAWSLHNSGGKLEGLSALIGLAINTIGSGLGGLLHCAFLDAASMFAGGIVAPVLGAVLSNLINPQALIISIGTAIATLIAGLVIEEIILRLIPDPINAWFYPFYIIGSFAFAIFAFHFYDELVT